jgi:hypothetical protein
MGMMNKTNLHQCYLSDRMATLVYCTGTVSVAVFPPNLFCFLHDPSRFNGTTRLHKPYMPRMLAPRLPGDFRARDRGDRTLGANSKVLSSSY